MYKINLRLCFLPNQWDGGGEGSNIQKHFELNHNPQNYLFVYMKKVLSEKKIHYFSLVFLTQQLS